MRYATLGDSDIEVSRMALGCWPFAGGRVWGPQDDKHSIAAVHASLDTGVNFFDTAEGYSDDSNSEEVLGRALAGCRDRAVIATKIGNTHLHPSKVAERCEGSLKRLQTDYIDLYQIHWPNHDVPVADTMAELLKLQDSGKVRALGVCNFAVQDLKDILECGAIVTNQLPYNLLWRALEFVIKPTCVANKVGIICYSPLQQGLLTGRYETADDVPAGLSRTRHFNRDREQAIHGEDGCEDATFATITSVLQIAEEVGEHPAKISLAWLLAQEGVTSLLVGARNAAEVALNTPSFDYDLPEGVEAELSVATHELKQILGDNADFWQSPGRMR
jgi:aryl-alcohol dehydrogenase-like predicted oxidoreductase